ncbi:hypothetical protein N9K61_02975 [Flavobacteriaceae bacterium]|nr:hypothetical protein [Flavobacteriaceae bacterium]
MKKSEYILKTGEYFKSFKDKDLTSLERLYASNIRLTDWVIDVTGKEKVLMVNKDLFKNDFKLEVISTKQLDKKTYNEITVEIGGEFINVFDIITFNDNLKIENITAYMR